MQIMIDLELIQGCLGVLKSFMSKIFAHFRYKRYFPKKPKQNLKNYVLKISVMVSTTENYCWPNLKQRI